jgi:RNA polymerase sigma-70 factor (ECF subfamily)
MEQSMSGPPRPPGDRRPRLTREEFDVQFKAAAGTLWCIAVAVLGSRTDAEDVIQDAAAIGFGKIAVFDPSTSFAAWMGEIVRNVARNHARKHDRRRTIPADPATIDAARPAAPSADPPAPLDAYARLADDSPAFDDRLLAALRTIEETPRACLLMRTLEEMPYRDIARVLGIPEGTAMSHVHRARAAMRKVLSEPDSRADRGLRLA